MQRKSLSSTYGKRSSLEQAIEDIQKPITEQPLSKPVSAGGTNPNGIPASPSQEHLQFVDGIDEVPVWLQNIVWAIITRMNQLTYIDSDFDFERMMCGVRMQLRPLVWKRKLTLLDMSQIEYFVGVQLRKSKSGRERRNIVPGYQVIAHQEAVTNQSLIDSPSQNNAAYGAMNKMNPRRSGR